MVANPPGGRDGDEPDPGVDDMVASVSMSDPATVAGSACVPLAWLSATGLVGTT